MAVAGDLVVRLATDNNALIRGTRSGLRTIRGFAGRTTGILKAAGGLAFKGFIAAGSAVLATGIASLKSFISQGSELSKISKQTGQSVSGLSELKFIAGQTGVQFDDVVGSIEELNIRLGETLRDGAGPAAEALNSLGISAKKLNMLAPVERIQALAGKLSAIKDISKRGFLADEIFGGDAFKIMPIIQQGTAGIQGLRKEARDLGLVIGDESAKKAAQLGQAWKSMVAQGKQVLFDLGEAIADVFGLKSAKEGIKGFARTFKNDWLPAIKAVMMNVKASWEFVTGAISKAWNFIFGSSGEAWEKIKFFARNYDLFTKLIWAKIQLWGMNTVQLFKNLGMSGLEIFKSLGKGIFLVFKNVFTQLLDNAKRFGKSLWKAIRGKGFDFEFRFDLLKGAREEFNRAAALLTKGFKKTTPQIERIIGQIAAREAKRRQRMLDQAKPDMKGVPAIDGTTNVKKRSTGSTMGSVEGAIRGTSAFFQRLADIRGQNRQEKMQEKANQTLQKIEQNTRRKPIPTFAFET